MSRTEEITTARDSATTGENPAAEARADGAAPDSALRPAGTGEADPGGREPGEADTGGSEPEAVEVTEPSEPATEATATEPAADAVTEAADADTTEAAL
ncbi:MAG: hypothetical protein QOI78_9402, partial [Actinomycetota bacterium]|nr:hypothetical protein [Actinomycetota bacterium]